MKTLYLLLFTLLAFSQASFSQEKWEPTNGPYPKKVSNLFYDEKHNELFDFSIYLDLYKSTDLGTTWTDLKLPDDRPAKQKIYYDYVEIIPSADNTLYALCVSCPTAYSVTSYLYRSTDRGETWTQENSINNSIYRIAADSKGNLFATTWLYDCSDQGVYMSTDQAHTFSLITKRINGGAINETFIAVNQNDVLFVGTVDTIPYYNQRELLSSTDNGASWNNLPLPDSLVKPLFFSTSHQGVLYGFDSNHKMTYSSDEGKTWAAPFSSPDYYSTFQNINRSISGNILFMSHSDSLFRSTDNGRTWNNYHVNNKTAGFDQVYHFTDSIIIAASSYNEVLGTTDNGLSWTNISTDHNKKIMTSDISARGNDVLIIADNHCFYSPDNGDTWSKLSGYPDFPIRCYIASDGTFYIYSSFSAMVPMEKLYYSTDKGQTWLGGAKMTVKTFCENSRGEIFIDSYGTLYTGSKNSWSVINLPQYIQSSLGSKSAVAMSPSDDLYIVCKQGLFSYNSQTGTLDTLDKMIDMPSYGTGYSAMAVSSKGRIFVVNNNNLFYSTGNEALFWDKIDDKYNLTGVKNVLINKNDEIFVQIDSGIAISRDEGNSWTLNNEGLSFKTLFTALAASDNGYAYSGFLHDRLYRRNKFPTSVEELSPFIKETAFAYPNPARDKVSISLPAVLSGQELNVEIYDVTGKAIRRNTLQVSGNNEITLDISAFDSGLYYAVFKAGANTVAEKFSVVK